jgi:serine/threonine protein kinase
VHRDVKPTNLLVDHKGQIKILDLGLARLDDPTSALSGLDRLTASGHTMGTLNYMAPEQAEDPHQADHRADIYSLGCTLHHLLTGHSPFRATVSLQMARDRAEEPVPSLCAARPDVPPLLEEVFQKMVAPRPADRYESMRDVLTALRAVTVALCATEDDRS